MEKLDPMPRDNHHVRNGSQLMRMTWRLSMALHDESVLDPRRVRDLPITFDKLLR